MTTEAQAAEAVKSASAADEVKIEMNDGDDGNGYFEWKNVNVNINGKQILHDVSGRVAKGQLLAILGGSGAGKSTLLNSISGRLLSRAPGALAKRISGGTGTQVTGDVAWRNERFPLGSSGSIKNVCAYVMQSDIMCPTATATEALSFSARLKLPESVSEGEREKIIMDVITELKLEKCSETMIGNDAIRGMSGGEKKRTSVGMELVTDPELIFLDEPTSGLDSFTALKTLQILKGLAKQGKQVIATIHQPSSSIFAMLDELCVLAHGHVVYCGPSSRVVDYFNSLPAPPEDPDKYRCPQFTNPADFVVNHVQQDSDFFIEQWEKNRDTFLQLAPTDIESLNVMHPVARKSGGTCLKMGLLLQREAQTIQRDPRPSKIRFIQTIVFAIFVGVLYWQLPHTQEGLRDRFGCIFFVTVNSSMTGLISTMIVFPEQRLLFERERNSNMYSTTLYLISKSLIQIPEQAIFTLFYLLIIYWMIGLDSEFWEAYVSLVLTVSTTGSLGLLIGCFANNAAEAMQLMPVGFIPFMLFAGFMVSLEQIPVWIRWLKWLDPFYYMVDVFSIIEFRGQRYRLENGFGFPSGDDYLDSLDVTNTIANRNFDWIMLFVLFVFAKIITWIVLVRRNGF